MKIIVIHIGDILKYPPVVSLINYLNLLNIHVDVITTISDFNKLRLDNVCFHEIPLNYEKIKNPMHKLVNIFTIRKFAMEMIDELYDNDTLIWITYNVTLKHLNLKKLVNYRYVLQLMELMEDIRYHEKLPFKINKFEVGKKAVAVVVPEYNRAHITKVWWKLDYLPCVLHNKPYYNISFTKNNPVDNCVANSLLNKVSGKKIILYQGILTKERPLNKFIEAIDMLGNDYAFVVMSSSNNIYENVKSSNYYFIPYVTPPYHLQITSHAYIGVLMYVPTKSEFSELNALYCAPNKVYEFGMFGVPMIANDLPSLQFLFKTEKCGVCFNDYNENSICEAIKTIESNYDFFCKNSEFFYKSTDYGNELCDILETVKNRIIKH